MAKIPSIVLNVNDILDSTDVRDLAGGVTRRTMMLWRAKDFPAPVKITGRGIELWDRRQVQAWLDARGN